MRVVKTDRGYIDMDHVLMVGEPYDFTQGLWGFDVTLAFLDKPKQMLYYPEDLGVKHPPASVGISDKKWRESVSAALTTKRDEFVALWKDEIPPIPMLSLWKGRPFNELLPDELTEAFDFLTAEHKAGRIEFSKMLELHQELRDAQATSICPQASDGKHAFSSQGCPAGMQACIHCEEIEL